MAQIKGEYYHFTYGDIYTKKGKLLEKGSIDVCSRGITLLIGENGTGKSTLLTRLYKENDCQGTYICQENYEIFKKLSVLENITLFQSGISEEHVMDVLKRYGMEHIREKKADSLSGGERRFIAVLRGVLSEEKLIFIDEPTNDLDYQTVEIIVRLLKDYKETKTFLIVTHDERMYSIMDCMYEIKDKKVSRIQEEQEFEQEIELEQATGKKELNNSSFIKRVITIDYCSYLCLFLLTCLTLYMFYFAKNEMSQSIERLDSNAIELCNSIYGDSRQLVNQGFVPTSFISYLNSDISFKELSKSLESGIEASEGRFYTLNLNVEENENYSVYNMQRMDMKTSSVVNTLDYCNIDGKNFVSHEEAYKDAIIKMDSEHDNQLENILVEIRMEDGYHFSDFIAQDKYQELWKGNYFIRSNETIEIVENARNIVRFNKVLRLWLTGAMILSLLIVYNTVINWFILKKRIMILVNYGFQKTDILKAVLQRNSRKSLYYGLFAFTELVMLALYVYYGSVKGIKDYIIVAVYTVLLFSIKIIQKRIYKVSVNRLYQIKGEL